MGKFDSSPLWITSFGYSIKVTTTEAPFSRAKAPPVKKNVGLYGDNNVPFLNEFLFFLGGGGGTLLALKGSFSITQLAMVGLIFLMNSSCILPLFHNAKRSRFQEKVSVVFF